MTVRSFGRYGLIVASALHSRSACLAAASTSRAKTPTPNLFVTTAVPSQ